jgi:hypothetical protein
MRKYHSFCQREMWMCRCSKGPGGWPSSMVGGAGGRGGPGGTSLLDTSVFISALSQPPNSQCSGRRAKPMSESSWDDELVTSRRVGPFLLILVGAAVFGIAGVVAAAYSAHDVLRLPHSTPTRAGPAWLSFGGGVGVFLGVGMALGVICAVRRISSTGRHTR